MRYQWNGETTTTDVVSALAAGLTGYAATYMALNSKAKCAIFTNGILGVGGIVAKGYTSNPTMHEILEGIGYGGFAGLGTWAAAVIAKKDNIPVWQPSSAPPTQTSMIQYFSPPVVAQATPVDFSNIGMAGVEQKAVVEI